MNNLPKDPHMLLSFVNTKLRDQFSSLDAFCDDYCLDKEDLVLKILSIDYAYDPEVNQFK